MNNMKKVRNVKMKNKILKKDEANAGVIIVAAILIVAVVTILLFSTGGSEYWETKTAFGEWRDEVTIEFADGTTESFKLIEESQELKVTHQGEEITNINIKLSAVVSGSGYDGAELKFDTADGYKFGYATQVFKGTSLQDTIRYATKEPGSTLQIPLDTTQVLLEQNVNMANAIEGQYPDGTYKVKFDMRGACSYRGYPDGGSYVDVALPPDRYITIEISSTQTGSILVVLKSGTTTT